jgi:hypothetical protein
VPHVYVEAADLRARQAAREREQARGGACHDSHEVKGEIYER